MRIGMIILFAVLYIALIALFILGYKKKQKKVWVTSLVPVSYTHLDVYKRQ